MEVVELLTFAHQSDRQEIAVARVDPTIAALLGARDNVVWLGREQLLAKLAKHPAIGIAEFALLQAIVDLSYAIRTRPNAVAFVPPPDLGGNASLYKVVVKSTSSGKLFLATFHRASATERRRLLRRADAVMQPRTRE
jgi:hypothetical protein